MHHRFILAIFLLFPSFSVFALTQEQILDKQYENYKKHKSLLSYLESVKPQIGSVNYEFIKAKAQRLPAEPMPSLFRNNKGDFYFQDNSLTFKVVSLQKGLFNVNGHEVNIRWRGGIKQNWELLNKVANWKVSHNIFIPQAFAGRGEGIKILGILAFQLSTLEMHLCDSIQEASKNCQQSISSLTEAQKENSPSSLFNLCNSNAALYHQSMRSLHESILREVKEENDMSCEEERKYVNSCIAFVTSMRELIHSMSGPCPSDGSSPTIRPSTSKIN